MTETCDAWAARTIRIADWDEQRDFAARTAGELQRRFPEAWTTGAGFVRSAFTDAYYLEIMDRLDSAHGTINRMARSLNLASTWIVPPAFRYPLEPGFVTWNDIGGAFSTSTSEDVKRAARAAVAAGRGTTDSAGTLYTRGGTAFIDPLVGWGPPKFWFGNTPIVPGWNGTTPIDRAAARATLLHMWSTMSRPDAPYLWWKSPSATWWPTAPISRVWWDGTSRLCRDQPRHQQCLRFERSGAIDDGWGDPSGHIMRAVPPVSPWLGPYANIRHTHRVLMQIAGQTGMQTVKRAVVELAAWERGMLLLHAAELEEKAARTGDSTTAAQNAANQKAMAVAQTGATVATAASGPWAPLVALASTLFFSVGETPGTITGARGYPNWPLRSAWLGVPIPGEEPARGLGPWPIWAVAPPEGLVCDGAVVGSSDALVGAKKSSNAGLWIGGIFATGVVAAIAVALARSGR